MDTLVNAAVSTATQSQTDQRTPHIPSLNSSTASPASQPAHLAAPPQKKKRSSTNTQDQVAINSLRQANDTPKSAASSPAHVLTNQNGIPPSASASNTMSPPTITSGNQSASNTPLQTTIQLQQRKVPAPAVENVSTQSSVASPPESAETKLTEPEQSTAQEPQTTISQFPRESAEPLKTEKKPKDAASTSPSESSASISHQASTESQTVIKPSVDAIEKLQEEAKLRKEEEQEAVEQLAPEKENGKTDAIVERAVREVEEDENYDE